MHMKVSKKSAFTMVELLAAVAIIGALTMLALPRYRAMIAKSRKAEAKTNLGTVRRLQEAYNLNQIALGATPLWSSEELGGGSKCDADDLKNALGFRFNDCANSRYLLQAGETTSTATSGTATAKVIYPGCTEIDVWSVTQASGQLANTTDAVAECSN